MQQLSVCELVRKQEQDWVSGETTHSEYVSFNIYNTLNRIDAYLNSKHISGDKDSMGRDKPFFNIVTAAVNIWYRATDIDRKNIVVRATSSKDTVKAFIFTLLLQKWMRQSGFGSFLNEWGRTLARYGSAISKFVDKGNELVSEVIPWNRIICDSIDFESNPKIEKIWLTPSQLQKRIVTHGYNEDFVNQIIEKQSFTSRTTANNQTKDNKSDYIPVYELHGELPLSLLTDKKGDENIYQQQIQVACFLERNEKGKYDDYILFKGKEKKDPYLISHLIKEDGQTLSIGAVQHLFEAQWMVNHSQKAIKDQLDLTSKVIYQTADGNFLGRNALTNIENGDIMVYKPNSPLTRINNNAGDIASLQSFQQQWQAVGNQINGISEAMMGENPPSGTAWRLQEAVLQESHSLFELMTENKGLDIIRMMNEYVVPFLKRKMDTADEISEILTEQQIKFIDELYINNHSVRLANEKHKEMVLNGESLMPGQQEMDRQAIAQQLQANLNQQGNQRFIKPSDIKDVTWKEYIKDLETDIEIDVTGESKDYKGAMATLATVLQTIAGLQGQPMSPEMKLVFDKILNLTGSISPLEVSQVRKESSPMPMAPTATPVPTIA